MTTGKRSYRQRYHATPTEQQILECYAQRWMLEPPGRKVSPCRQRILEEARRALQLVSRRAWEDPARERYEIRQWFNRWIRANRHRFRFRPERPVDEPSAPGRGIDPFDPIHTSDPPATLLFGLAETWDDSFEEPIRETWDWRDESWDWCWDVDA
jgi:hypothetical protein